MPNGKELFDKNAPMFGKFIGGIGLIDKEKAVGKRIVSKINRIFNENGVKGKVTYRID